MGSSFSQVALAVQVAITISRELDDDYVEIWKTPWHLRRELPTSGEELVIELADAILRGLQGSGIVVGTIDPKGAFLPSRSQETAVDEVMKRWRALGRDPNMGEIGWLAWPREGDSCPRTPGRGATIRHHGDSPGKSRIRAPEPVLARDLKAKMRHPIGA